MKTLLITCVLVCISLFSFSQTIYQIRADSVRIYNTCDTAELILENRTQNVAGFLYNKGKGRTEFRKLTFDSTLIFGAYKNNTAGDSVLTTDSNGVVKFVHKSTLGGGGGGGLQTLQQVTDTGNTTTNLIRITNNKRIPVSGGPALELSMDTSVEYNTRGPLAAIRVRDRIEPDEWGYDNSSASYLSLDAKGLVVENKLQNPLTRALITPGGPDIYYADGFTILAQQREDTNTFWGDGVLSLQGSRVNLRSSISMDGPVGYTAVQTSWGTQNQYIGPTCYTYLLIHNAPTIHLPAAGTLPGRVIFVKRTLTGNYQTTIDVEDGGKIDNNTTATITNYLTSIQFQSDGTNWWILSRTGN